MFLNALKNPLRSTCHAWRSLATSAEPQVVASLEKSLNKVTLLGRVGMNPQLRGSESSPVVVFTLATNCNYKYETGEIQQKTEWHRISVFRPFIRNNVMTNMKKGARVFVEGRITYGEILDVRGISHVTSTIIATEVIFFGSKNPASESSS